MRQSGKPGEFTTDRVDDERLALKINGEIDEYRPQYSDFAEIYTIEEMRADRQEVFDYQEKKHIVPEEERRKLKDGILVEKIIFDTDMNDLLGEEVDEMYDTSQTGEGDHLLKVIPAHTYDDYFNNVDMICAVTNEFTDHETVPFAVDCTSNSAKVHEKMGYRRTKEHIPGFTDVKYFKDTTGVGASTLETGSLEKVPRFIVGIDAELAREIVEFDPRESTPWQKEENDQRYDHVRYYMLQELRAQASGKDGRLERYFTGLLQNFIRSRGKTTVERYPRDPVCDSILSASQGQKALEAA